MRPLKFILISLSLIQQLALAQTNTSVKAYLSYILSRNGSLATISTADCIGYVTNDATRCGTNDCLDLIRGNAMQFASVEAMACATHKPQFCNSVNPPSFYGDCFGASTHQAQYCQSADCKAFINPISYPCKSNDCKALVANQATLCESKTCLALITHDTSKCK